MSKTQIDLQRYVDARFAFDATACTLAQAVTVGPLEKAVQLYERILRHLKETPDDPCYSDYADILLDAHKLAVRRWGYWAWMDARLKFSSAQ